MALERIKITDFRCLASVQAAFHPSLNLVCGPNAAGKTSLLEAIAYLGRGRSFRGASTDRIVRHGCKTFVVFAEVTSGGSGHRLGVRNGPEGLEASIDGESGSDQEPDIADLAANRVAGSLRWRRRFPFR